MKFFSKSITRKLLGAIILPSILMFLILAIVVVNGVKNNVVKQNDEIIKESSNSISLEIDKFFSDYSSIVKSWSVNTTAVNFLNGVTPGVRLNQTPQYDTILQQLQKIAAIDEENIMAVWIGDSDSSQVMTSDGYLSDENYDITQRSWFIEAKDSKDVIITEPYLDDSTNKNVVSIVAPVIQNNQMIGVVGIDLSIDHLSDIMKSAKIGKTGFSTFISKEGVIVYSPNEQEILKNINEVSGSESIRNMINNNKQGNVEVEAGDNSLHGYVKDVGDTSWNVCTFLPDKEYNETLNSVVTLLITMIIITLVVIGVIVYIASNNIVKPLKKLAVAADKIADGDLDVDLNVKTKDETFLVADSFNRTVLRLKSYIAYINEISALLEQIGEGDLKLTFQQAYDGEFKIIKDALVDTSNMLNQTLTEFNIAADQVASGSNQVAAGAQALSQGATEQASSIEELSSTINEISAQIKETAQNAEKAKDISEEATVATNHSQQQMEKMIEAMNKISDTSNEIGKIIKNIDDIAFQTNILALNAAVEAARAGSAGKGFAVVAEEVRNLAGKSAESAKSTATLIESARAAIENGTKIVSDTAKALEDVVEGAKSSTEVVRLIADASVEQSTAISQVNIGIGQISDVVQTNSATAEESAAASEELSGQAQVLKELIEKFKLYDDDNNIKSSAVEDDYSNSFVPDTYSNNSNSNTTTFKPTQYIDL